MSKKQRGLRIGHYQITPLGIGVLVVILLLILAVAAYFILKYFGILPFGDATRPVTNSNVNVPVIVNTPEPTQAPIPTDDSTAPEPTPTETPVPTPTPAPTLRSARIRTIGEIIADNDILKSAYIQQQDDAGNDTSTFDFGPIFETAGSAIGNADYTIAVVDGSMGGKGVNGYRGKDKEYNTPPHIMLALRECGVDMMALATDHALDELFDGLTKTIGNCGQAELDYIGAAASQEEHDTPKIVPINGINFAFLNYSESFNGKEKNAAKDALTFGVSYMANANYAADVEAARTAGADIVVAYVSWGKQGSASMTKSQVSIAKQLVTAGVDVIIGYNSRVLQDQKDMYWLEADKEDGTKQRTLCLVSLGSFLTASQEATEKAGMIFEFSVSETEPGKFEVANPTYIPTYVWRTQRTEDVYDYRVLAVGQWLANAPEGMAEKEYETLKTVWSEMQSKLGSTVLSVAAD